VNNGIINSAYINPGYENADIKGCFSISSGGLSSPVPLPYYLSDYTNKSNIDYKNLVLVFDTRLSAGTTITLNFQTAGTFYVDYGDGNIVYYMINIVGTRSYTYKTHGIYTVQIYVPVYTQMFLVAQSSPKLIKILSIGNMNTSNMFQAFPSLINLIEIPQVLPSSVTTLSTVFSNCSKLNDINLTYWNTSNVTNMNSLFQSCVAFNRNLGNWNTSNVTTMTSMFQGATNFNNENNSSMNSWDVSKVTNFSNLFNGATSFNGDLSNWQLVASNVNCTSMFQGASTFNQDIGSWNTSGIINMEAMFFLSTNFNNNGSSSISGWNTSNVTTMRNMFRQCNFNQPIDSWNVSKVTNMENIFYFAPLFNQPLTNWNLAGLNINSALDNFMGGKTGSNSYSTANYDALLIGWNNNKLLAANGVANWRTDLRPNFGGAKYTAGGAAATARAALVSYGWTITDGGTA
jgi:surface protein